ncbi:kunitz-type protease inhibitor 1-like [Thalassophryne amazonica]|uniref:kunitz-type protease inhibitor 1-like n=1 Tax=Thalassophryne amazonica TaxID=390379 RepID=UPI00147264DF|nr:kunitz-type protease inhibitor 1-like [Thalassophryne amazonica]
MVTSFLLLLLLLHAAAADDCRGRFRAGPQDFVLDAEDAVTSGALFLFSSPVQSATDCEKMCCAEKNCNLALLESDQDHPNRTCSLFNCLYRNQFVCRFVNKAGFTTYIRASVFQKYLQGPSKLAPPIANAGWNVVVQPGVVVTLNGSESLALGDAHITDYHWSELTRLTGVKMETTDLPDQVRVSNLQPGLNVFQLTVTDSKGQSGSARVNVHVLGPEQSALFCLAPVKVGPCRAAFTRWWFNAATGSCEHFVFGGCKQNHNNFLSDEDCLSACSGVTVTSERSMSLPITEVCGSPCHHDQVTCGSGCCLDQSLECDGKPQCKDGADERICSTLNQTFTELLNIDVNQKRARCTEPPLTGPCRASHSRWYYDPLNTRCHRFTYGGCHGNDNKFLDEEACSTTCHGVTENHVFARGTFERFEEDEEDDSNSGSIALAVVLAVAILALLSILAYCFLKSRRERSQRPSATGPAHVALAEQDTLVYKSTTKPV